MKAPDKIYLQVCGTCPLGGVECERCNFDELKEVTWSTDKVFDKDVAYIRKDFLLEWAKNTKESVENNKPFNDVKMGFVSGVALLIDKLNSL